MLVKMLETHRGSEDGFDVRKYLKGETYDMAHGLAVDFQRKGWAYNADPGEDPEMDYADALLRALNTMSPLEQLMNLNKLAQ